MTGIMVSRMFASAKWRLLREISRSSDASLHPRMAEMGLLVVGGVDSAFKL